MIQPLVLAVTFVACALPLAGITPEELIQKQVDAYNAHDLDAFVACFGKDIEFRTMDGNVNPEKGTVALRKGYADLFKRFPELRVKVLKRIRQGAYVIDQQQAEGMGPNPVTVTAIYQIDQDKIIRVWYLEG